MAYKKVETQGDLVPAWDFVKNTVLEGIVKRRRSGVGKNNSMMYDIETEKEDEAGNKLHPVWGCKAIDDAMMEIKDGEQVRITYTGEVELKDGNSMHGYDVEVDRPETEEAAK